MSKEQVMDYVMTTPSNPNRAVLSGMLDAISGTQLPSPTESDNGKVLGVDGGEYKLVEQSGGGYSCTESTSLLFEETVTTEVQEDSTGSMVVGMFTYAEPIDADELVVTFNGTEYTCPKKGSSVMASYGADPNEESMDFSEYPFSILSQNLQGSYRTLLITAQAGTYSVKGESHTETIETTPCFDKAVTHVTLPLLIKYSSTGSVGYYFDKTAQEVQEAVNEGRMVMLAVNDRVDRLPIRHYYPLHDMEMDALGAEPTRFGFSGNNLLVEESTGRLYMQISN